MTIYDKSQFDLVDRSVFWLSETPETVSLGWGAACYRICVVTVLQHKATGNLLNVYNVHLDHEAAAAQINGINLVLSRMADRKSGYNLVMGDFNVDNTNDAYKAIASKMNDCQVVAPNADLGCTFNGWSNATSGNSIDFIFVDKANTLPRNFNILRDTWGSGYNYSDHYAIRSNIAFGYTNEYIAQPVIAKINALPSTVTLANESEVTSARSAYNALTSAQRAYVTNLSKLTSAEQTVTDIKAANAVITQIDALPSTVTLANESAVTSARNAYEALTSAQRTYVTNLSKLTTAEQTITAIKAANSVMTKINAIPSPVTLISESVIVEARNAYNSLSDTQKSYVTNLSKLTAAETAITDMKTASAVVSKIEAIPSPVTLADESAIVTARNAYNGLTDAQKAYVPNLSKLTAAETAIADMKAASAVVTQIFNLPAIVTLADESAVAEARSAYNALSDAQKAQVPNLSKLTSAEKTISDIKTANEVVAKIDALVSSDSEAIAEARNAYDALSDSQKQYVTNLAKLEQLEAEFSVIYGDLNGDGTVSAVDALLVLQHAVNKITLKDRLLVAADVTSPYGEITSADALAILQYSVELIDSFEVSTK